MATRPAIHIADRVAIAVLAAMAIIAALTFRDYGLGWDDVTHSQYGELLLKLYGSGFADTRALSFVNLYKYGGGFDMAAALAAKVLPLGLFETRRLIGALVGLIGLFVVWRLGRRLGGPVAGMAALVLLAACPLYTGHMFMNAKDSPFATAMAVLLYGIVAILDDYPKPNARAVALFGVGLGFAFGTRVLAGLAAPYGLAAISLIVAADARAHDIKAATQRLGQFVLAILPALVLGYLIMALLWPWSILKPLNPLYAAEYFDTFFEKPWKELYEGRLISVPDMPASYLPNLFALKLPVIMLAFGLIGVVGALVVVARPSVAVTRRASLLTLALAVILPIAVAIVMHPAFYNGLRHFIFIVPPFAVAGGLAFGWLFERARLHGTAAAAALCAILIGGIGLPLYDMVKLHPYEYTSFNTFAGGVRQAQHQYMLDYWGLAFKQASDQLRAQLAASSELAPKDRSWVVAICGPQATAQQQLGPQFETTFNDKQADFAMVLGTFYCQHLKAPILVEIAREGVVYARVYDLRGRPTPNLLTVPKP
jgi:hypothetical protein